ncbi:MAG: hypothetical protein Q9159_007761, partial [Coniocarpon cinnabarinum]
MRPSYATTRHLQLLTESEPLTRHLAPLHRKTRGTFPDRRHFHDYFVTHLPSSSLHPDSRSAHLHKLPRDHSTPHNASTGTGRAPFQQGGASHSRSVGLSREMTIVRIPLKSAKHHFGATCVRGTRPYNEDAWQAGTIEMPAFARRAPVSLNINRSSSSARSSTGDGEEGSGQQAAESAVGDPQVFYFGVFDGHGGEKCSHFLRDKLHSYVEKSAEDLGMQSTLHEPFEWRRRPPERVPSDPTEEHENRIASLVAAWRDTVGGYYRRFKPDYFSTASGGKGIPLTPSILRHEGRGESRLENSSTESADFATPNGHILSYSFLSADLDFVNAQVPPSPFSSSSSSSSSTPNSSSKNSNDDALLPDDNDALLGRHIHHSAPPPFLGGSTCSLTLISTPSPTPFWHPATPLTIVTAHVGDTRVLLCATETGAAVPLTTTHHPSSPTESARLRRYAGAFTTDSFGEERFAAGLANTRSFGDVRSKRIGVSSEPDLKLLHLKPAEGAFLVLVSDGVSGVLSDQEITDVVKEAKTPEQGS